MRKRLLDGSSSHRNRHQGVRWAAALVAGVTITALAFVWLRWHRHVEVPLFYVDGRPSEVRGFVATPAEQVSQLSFGGGSRVRLQPSSAMRVLEVSEHGATINLEHGKVQADIVPRAGNDWQVTAGPFTVRVIGTRFGVDWDSGSGQLTVDVERGKVSVWGSFISRREVQAGHKLVADVSTASVVESSASTPPTPAGTSVPTPQSEPRSDGESAMRSIEATAPTKTASAVVPGNAKPVWRQLADAGRFGESLAEVETTGFESVCASASASDLLLLGDVARLASQPGRARQAFLAVRTRFPQDSRRVAAAFSLGKVAFDKFGDWAQAADWFRTCLREQPEGTLAREARGRLMESLMRLGDRQDARQAAEEYLSKYPSGPHAAVARSLLRN